MASTPKLDESELNPENEQHQTGPVRGEPSTSALSNAEVDPATQRDQDQGLQRQCAGDFGALGEGETSALVVPPKDRHDDGSSAQPPGPVPNSNLLMRMAGREAPESETTTSTTPTLPNPLADSRVPGTGPDTAGQPTGTSQEASRIPPIAGGSNPEKITAIEQIPGPIAVPTSAGGGGGDPKAGTGASTQVDPKDTAQKVLGPTACPGRKSGAWAALLSLGSDLTPSESGSNITTVPGLDRSKATELYQKNTPAPVPRPPNAGHPVPASAPAAAAVAGDTNGTIHPAIQPATAPLHQRFVSAPPYAMAPPHPGTVQPSHPSYPHHVAQAYPAVPQYYAHPNYHMPGYHHMPGVPPAIPPGSAYAPPNAASLGEPKLKRRKLPKAAADAPPGGDLPSDFWYWLPPKPVDTRDAGIHSRPDRHGFIGEFDVLCGRGGESNNATGNKRYRRVVNERKAEYRKIPVKNRKQKTEFVRSIVDYVHSYGGRFIDLHEPSGRYYAVSIDRARKKTSQALRETKELKWLETSSTMAVPVPAQPNPNFDFSLPGTRKMKTPPPLCPFCGRPGHKTWQSSACHRHAEWLASEKAADGATVAVAPPAPSEDRTVDSSSPSVSVHCI